MTTKRELILDWVESGHLPPEQAEAALRLSGGVPDRDGWWNFFDRLLLWGGAVLLAVGVLFFFAYNWSNIGVYPKFALGELALIIAVAISLLRPAGTVASRAALFAAAILVGTLLALFGQTYQTGADPWQLFAVWALALLPWALVSRTPLLWLLLLALANLALGLYFQTFSRPFWFINNTTSQLWAHLLVNAAAVALWEWQSSRCSDWMNGRLFPRIGVLGCAASLCTLVIIAVFDHHPPLHQLLAVLLAGAFLLWAGYLFYRIRQLDLFVLSVGALALIVTVTTLLARGLFELHFEESALLLIGAAVLGMSAGCGLWLKRLAGEVPR